MPKRIQRKRTAGWRMPDGAVYVGRPSRWGNPITIERHSVLGSPLWTVWASDVGPVISNHNTDAEARAVAVDRFAAWLRADVVPAVDAARHSWIREHIAELAGKDLACWCPLDQPCHADVLLEIANPTGEGSTDGH
jgi:hypothetical protein